MVSRCTVESSQLIFQIVVYSDRSAILAGHTALRVSLHTSRARCPEAAERELSNLNARDRVI